MNRVILSLGSNINDRILHLKEALQQIEEKAGSISQKSSVYETEAIGFISDIPFYNMCIEVETSLSPELLLKKTQEIEIEIGRSKKTTQYYESRKIDIDIIFYASRIIETTTLTIPHRNFHQRKFVLLPLQEINQNLIDPRSLENINDLIALCTDNSYIKITSIIV